MTSLDGINGWSIQTLPRGENDSKRSDEIQTKTTEDSLVFNALVFLHTQEEENSPSRALVIVNTLLTEFFLPGTIGNLKPVNIIIFQAVFLMMINHCRLLPSLATAISLEVCTNSGIPVHLYPSP